MRPGTGRTGRSRVRAGRAGCSTVDRLQVAGRGVQAIDLQTIGGETGRRFRRAGSDDAPGMNRTCARGLGNRTFLNCRLARQRERSEAVNHLSAHPINVVRPATADFASLDGAAPLEPPDVERVDRANRQESGAQLLRELVNDPRTPPGVRQQAAATSSAARRRGASWSSSIEAVASLTEERIDALLAQLLPAEMLTPKTEG